MKKTLKITCLISAILIVVAIVLFVLTLTVEFGGDDGRYGTFGADYYTYVVQNLQDIAYNTCYGTLKIMRLGKIVACSIECIMLCLGVFGMVFSIEKINIIKKAETDCNKTPLEID